MSADVNFICKIDRELYRVVEQELLTEEVIITEEQILHIEEGHPGDYGRLSAYISYRSQTTFCVEIVRTLHWC